MNGITINRRHTRMLLLDSDNSIHTACDYDGRTFSDREATNLSNYNQLSKIGSVRHWTLPSGHSGFFVLQPHLLEAV